MKKAALACLISLSLALPLAAQTQQVTKVGLVDFMKILLTAYKDTKGYRDYDQAFTDYNKEVSARTKEIVDLQNQKLDADKAGNKTLSLSLDKTISDKQKDLNTYKTVKAAVLQQQLSSVMSGPVVQEIMDVITYEAELGGYALILRKDSSYAKDMIIYSLAEVDITQDVIDEIMKRQGKSTGG